MAQNSRLKRRQKLLNKLGSLAPRFSPAIELKAGATDDYFHSFPFKRSLPAIAISAGILVALSVPLLTVASSLSGSSDELFSFTSMAFSLFWMLGWSVGVIFAALVLLVFLFGRETLHVTPESLILRLGVFGLGLGFAYPRELIRNFRPAESPPEKGSEWRGEHLLFDFAGEPVAFGCNVSGEQARLLLDRLAELFPDQGSPLPDLSLRADPTPGNELPATETVAAAPVALRELPQSAIHWYSPSALTLIAANLVPLAGVLFAGWDVGDLMLLFWAESAVIGLYNLLKMARVAGLGILFLGPFFVAHYGGFMAVHLLFIYTLFINGANGGTDVPLPVVLQDFFAMLPALVGFVISHGVSYSQNFLGRREYLGRDGQAQMGQPYKRIIIMHITIIFGGFMVMGLESALPALLLLITMKLGADLYAHLHEHRMVTTDEASEAGAN